MNGNFEKSLVFRVSPDKKFSFNFRKANTKF